MPRTTKVSATPTEVALLKKSISTTDSGEASIAPPPKPIIARPVAMPGLSGNHFISVETGPI